jgi:hypothetical protein
MTTPVIFRKVCADDSIIAFFPTNPGSNFPFSVVSYEHTCQYSNVGKTFYESMTIPAKPDEYKDLLEELISMGYDDLKVYQRWYYWMDTHRWNELRKIYGD